MTMAMAILWSAWVAEPAWAIEGAWRTIQVMMRCDVMSLPVNPSRRGKEVV
jgi:hypothetical protein